MKSSYIGDYKYHIFSIVMSKGETRAQYLAMMPDVGLAPAALTSTVSY